MKFKLTFLTCLIGVCVQSQFIKMSWDKPDDDTVIGYKLYIGLDTNHYSNTITVTNHNQTNVIVDRTQFFPGTQNSVAVSSVSNIGTESEKSTPISFYFPSKPRGPYDVFLTDILGPTAFLNWRINPSSEPTDKFFITWTTNNVDFYPLYTEYTNRWLVPFQPRSTNYYRVRSLNDAGQSPNFGLLVTNLSHMLMLDTP